MLVSFLPTDKIKRVCLVVAIIAGLNALFHLVDGNLIRAALSAVVAALFGLEASGRPALRRAYASLRETYRGLRGD